MAKTKEYKAPFFVDDIDRIMFVIGMVLPTIWAVGGLTVMWLKS